MLCQPFIAHCPPTLLSLFCALALLLFSRFQFSLLALSPNGLRQSFLYLIVKLSCDTGGLRETGAEYLGDPST
jgi:hypothetical protein